MAKKETWWEKTFWVAVTGVSTLIIGFGIIEYVKAKGLNPLYLVLFGFIGLGIVIYFKKIRTTTSMGNRK